MAQFAYSKAGTPVATSTTAAELLARYQDTSTGNIWVATGIANPTQWVLDFTAETVVPVANGGTNSSAALSGSSIMVSNGTSVVQGAAGTATTVLHGNASGAPTFGAVSLTADVSGTLPVGNGGTGITSLGTGVATWLGTPSSANLASAVTDETGSGSLVFATSPTLVTPVLGTPTSGTLSNCTVDGTTSVGFRTVPANSQSAAYTTVLADSGKSIDHPATDANARTFTIDSNANVAYPIGTCISFSNMTSQAVTIAITSDTMYLAGTGSTGSRTLAQYGVATARKILSTTWLISGTNLT